MDNGRPIKRLSARPPELVLPPDEPDEPDLPSDGPKQAFLNFEDVGDGTFYLRAVWADHNGAGTTYDPTSPSHQHARIALKVLDSYLKRLADPDTNTIGLDTELIVPDGDGNLLCPLCGQINEKAMNARG